MNRYLLVFSLALSLGVYNASAEDLQSSMNFDNMSVSDSDIDIGEINIDDIDLDEMSSSSTVSSDQNNPPMVIKNVSKNNTFPLSRNGMMISPTPVSSDVSLRPISTTTLEAKPTKQSGSKIGKDASLTGMFDEKSGESLDDLSVDDQKKSGNPETWLDKLRSSAEAEIKGSGKEKKEASSDKEKDGGLSGLIENSKLITAEGKRSNAAVFDVSGAMLRMNPQQIDDVLKRKGYKKTNEKYEVPNFIKWRKEEECRASGVVGYERLASCMYKSAQNEGYQYLETVSYSKYDTQESMTISFTSNFTSNKAFKIIYSSMASNVTGNSPKAIYLRNIKIYDFWKRINQKYGAPDNKEDVIWGLGGNKPYMQAKTGKLLLEDPMLRELDYTRMSREDQKFINTGMYNF